MQVKVLGPLDVTVNGGSITPTASKARQTLAMLALHAGQLVTVPTLMEELWGAALPRKPLQSVQTYVLILRRMIDEAQPGGKTGDAKSVLTTAHGGYMLDISADDLDIHRYERLGTAGRRAMESGDYEAASRLLRSALDLWRGPARAAPATRGPSPPIRPWTGREAGGRRRTPTAFPTLARSSPPGSILVASRWRDPHRRSGFSVPARPAGARRGRLGDGVKRCAARQRCARQSGVLLAR